MLSFSIEVPWYLCQKSIDHMYKVYFWTLCSPPWCHTYCLSNIVILFLYCNYCGIIGSLQINLLSLFFSLKISLCIFSNLNFQTHFSISLSISTKKILLGFDWDFIESVDKLGDSWPLNNIESSINKNDII